MPLAADYDRQTELRLMTEAIVKEKGRSAFVVRDHGKYAPKMPVIEYDPARGSTLFPQDHVRPRLGTSNFEYGAVFHSRTFSSPSLVARGEHPPFGTQSVGSGGGGAGSSVPPPSRGSHLSTSSSLPRWSPASSTDSDAAWEASSRRRKKHVSSLGRIERLEALYFGTKS
eukprot:TRINITY_DN31060_c0_g1_i1.p1 TRINITY_DN31060_c0_g1~~TRINITY_DN31060_c0_g1_i1.p1  ORF type:complete len:199 (+),score=24.89 TRINITY_DN31060_c0_g1_i1:88-597(+)